CYNHTSHYFATCTGIPKTEAVDITSTASRSLTRWSGPQPETSWLPDVTERPRQLARQLLPRRYPREPQATATRHAPAQLSPGSRQAPNRSLPNQPIHRTCLTGFPEWHLPPKLTRPPTTTSHANRVLLAPALASKRSHGYVPLLIMPGYWQHQRTRSTPKYPATQ